ncbi:MAG: protein-L-isoaspartate(D-aspartate) O-methyltransferase [Candidatus Lokiarchaeota archaeon]|nr:protein-L-isoaspartate(D-aspartate) O-methyltransferase [Candidatus Lokiarchaeota archaeon]MBD3341354.1 protein-L-isoaspartate(D-aspartate) O-methyltransferase [Candidatus Lokiarchaeota archaeon]
MSFEQKRKKLVDDLISKGILKSEKVIDAMLKVPREKFLPEKARSSAYIDSPLSIGSGQTISAPHMNAMMCEYLELKEGDKVLEVGTGSGYHAALCAEIVAPEEKQDPKGHVYTIERHEDLAQEASIVLEKTGYDNRVTVIHGDGTLGYSEAAPYDKILVTAASPKKIPSPLKKQLADGGVMCIPAGSKRFSQNLYIVKKIGKEFETKRITGVRFVPLLGKYGFD